ncbi:MAG: DUF1080 domain-containing protein [Opitutaceae bacterium]
MLNQERAAGWQLLFDGKTMAGWRGFRDAPIAGWEVRDGTLHAIAKTGVNLITAKTFSDFELTFARQRGQSGIACLRFSRAKRAWQ